MKIRESWETGQRERRFERVKTTEHKKVYVFEWEDGDASTGELEACGSDIADCLVTLRKQYPTRTWTAVRFEQARQPLQTKKPLSGP